MITQAPINISQLIDDSDPYTRILPIGIISNRTLTSLANKISKTGITITIG